MDLRLKSKSQTKNRAKVTFHCENSKSEPIWASGVPNLSLDDFVVDADAASGELHTDCGLGLQAELVASESGEQIGFTDAGIADEHNLEQVIVVVVSSVGTHE